MFLISLVPSPLALNYLAVDFVSGLQVLSLNWYIYTTNIGVFTLLISTIANMLGLEPIILISGCLLGLSQV